MSEYTSSRATIVATPTNQELIAALLAAEFGSAAAWVPSERLCELRRTVATGDLRALDPTLLRTALALPTVDREVGAVVRAALADGPPVAEQYRKRLGAALADAEHRTIAAERRCATALAVGALKRIGFSVRHADNGSAAAIEARRRHTVFVVGVEGGGRMEMDWLGHGGLDCEREMAEVRQAFAEGGLTIAVHRRVRHGSADGGSLIARASRAGDGDLITGLLAESAETPTVEVARRRRRATATGLG